MMAMPGGGPFGRHAERLARRRMLRRRMDDMLPVDVPVAIIAL